MTDPSGPPRPAADRPSDLSFGSSAIPADLGAGAGADPGADPGPESAEKKNPTIFEQMGGPSGMLDSGLPVVVFVIANGIGGLTAGIIAAVVAAVLIFTMRLIRHRPVTQAVSGLFGVGIAAFIAHRSGSAGGYFVLGIWSYLIYGALLLLSILIRVPAVGLIWEGINGRGLAWRRDRALVRKYDYATAVWVAVFAVRYFVQNALLDSDQIGWLGFARIAMGYPLYLLGIGASVLIVMRGTGWKRPPLKTLLGR